MKQSENVLLEAVRKVDKLGLPGAFGGYAAADIVADMSNGIRPTMSQVAEVINTLVDKVAE